MSADIRPAVRETLLAMPEVQATLAEWRGEPAVFTRRPIPADAGSPQAIVNSPVSVTDEDGLTSDRPVIVLDIAVYGVKAAAGTASDQTRAVDALGWAIRDRFHRDKFSVRPAGFSAIGVTATGPIDAPVDDDATVGRIVTLTVRLRRNT